MSTPDRQPMHSETSNQVQPGWYQKKPVMVQAYRAQECEFIETLEGRMRADAGDWVVTGIKGERYPVKNDIFMASYRRVG